MSSFPRSQSPFTALRHTDYRWFYIGQLFSLIGTWVQSTGQGWLVTLLADSEQSASKWLGIVSILGALPMFLGAFIGGAIADQFPKRTLILWMQVAQCTIALSMAALVMSGHIRLWHIPIFAALFGITHVFDMPARQAFLVDLVGKEDLPNAIGLNSSMFNGARVLGPWVAAKLIQTFGVGHGELAAVGQCFLVNGLSYIGVITGLLLVKVGREAIAKNKEPLTRQLKEVITYLSSYRSGLALITLLAGCSLCMTGDWILLPALAKFGLSANAGGYGILMSMRGVGALIAALLMASFTGFHKKGVLVLCSAFAWGLCSVLLANCGSMAAGRWLIVAVGFSMILFLVTTNTLLQTSTPDHLRGRVMGVHAWLMIGLTPLGSLFSSAIASAVGVVTALTIGGSLTMIIVLVVALRFPALRNAKSALPRCPVRFRIKRITQREPIDHNVPPVAPSNAAS